MDAVTTVLLERARDDRGMNRMVTLSTIAHAALGAVVVLVPAIFGTHTARDERPVMTISLGSAPGPRAGGMALEGRPASREPAQMMDSKRPTILKPAPREPAMVIPTPNARTTRKPPKPQAEPAVQPAPPVSRETVPFGAQATANDNPARGMGFGGLSTGGMGGSGGYLEVSNFCCPEYLNAMLQVLQRNWKQTQGIDGLTQVKFVIQRDGRITGIDLEQSSGYAPLDLAAQRALFLTQRVQPLPAAFSDASLTIHLRFEYHR